MEAITLTALGVFLAPYLQKAGEKVAEKTVETLFDARKDLADRFTSLFKPEIISLGLSDNASTGEITENLEARPEIKEEVEKKIVNNQDLLSELVEAFKQMPGAGFEGVTINATKIAQVNIRPQNVSQTIENF